MAEDLSNDSGAVLFVDDDADVLASAELLLGRRGYRMATARTPTEAWSVLATEVVDVILLDLNFTHGATSGVEGLQWLREIRARDRDAVVVVVTAHSGVNIAVTAMKAGASDFVMKPWNNARFLETVSAAQALRRQRRQARADESTGPELPPILGESAAIERVRALIERAAPTEAAVLILGEPGSGKSLAARTLHARSARAAGPFVGFDPRGLPAETIGKLLRQAVVDATTGVLFLDEVAALPPLAQAELLALLDGAPDIRLISASTGGREALRAVRDDLFSRLATVEILLPSLAERARDAVLLTEHFVRLFSRRYGRAAKPLEADAIELLLAAPPPGEARGLRQAAERAVVLSEGKTIAAADLMPATGSGSATPLAGPDLNLARSEKAVVEAALKRHAHNVSQAAKDLGVTRATLYRRMVKHGL